MVGLFDFSRFFVSICPSTDSDIISRISESANPASHLYSLSLSLNIILKIVMYIN